MQLLNNTIRNGEMGLRVTDKQLAILYEIGLNLIPTATEFVESMALKYDVSQSGVWYTLKKLKIGGLVDFAEKGEDHKPLSLTDAGTATIRSRIVDVEKRQYHYAVGMMQAVKSRA